jgi:hypothetical protein
MNYQFWLYVFSSFIVISGSTYYFYSKRQEITAGIMFFGMLIGCIFFGFRWFPASGATTISGKWPPVINYCPDFLTLNTVNGEKVCVDTIGVAQAGGMSVWSDPTQTDEKYLFHLFLNLGGEERIQKLCQQAKAKMVTWEGVWDGAVCMGKLPPPPSS